MENETSNNKKSISIISENSIKDKIYTIRGIQVMLDSDLAEIYGYSTKAFNQQVKNNIERFDEDFRFQLTDEEVSELSRSKILTSMQEVGIKGGRTYNPYVFTEQGIYMLMTVLKGELAVSQSKMLVRLFKQMKDYIVENQQVIGQRDFIRLSLQAAENSQSIAEFKQKLYDIDNKVQNVVSNLGKMVRKSELSPIMFSLGKNETPVGWILFDGKPVEGDLAYQQIYSLANKSIYIVDNYISLKTLVLFKHAKQNIEVTIFSENKNKGLHKLEFDDFCKEYPGLKINLKTTGNKHHDRFIVLDYKTTDEKMYLSGASSKDAGKKISSISKMLDPNLFHPVIDELLKNPALVL